MDDRVHMHAARVDLREQLQPRRQVAGGAGRVAPAARDHIGLASVPPQLPRQILDDAHQDVVIIGLDDAHLRAEDAVQQEVPLRRLAVEHHDRLEPQPPCGRGGHAGVVGLDRAHGDHHIAAQLAGLPQQELQLAGLVAAQRQPRQIVALHPDARPVQVVAEARRFLQRRGEMRELDARKIAELHSYPPKLRSVSSHARSASTASRMVVGTNRTRVPGLA